MIKTPQRRYRRKSGKNGKPKGLMDKGSISKRDSMVVSRYLIHFNKSRALAEVGITTGEYLKHPGHFFRKPRVAAEIERLYGDRLRRNGLTAERTLEEIRRLMTSNIVDVLDDEGKMVNLKDLPEDVQACISEVRFGDDGKAKSVKFWPKPQALHLAATHLRLLVELSEQKTSLEIRIREMTPDQRKQYAIELLDKARNMLPGHVAASDAEFEEVNPDPGAMGGEGGAELGDDGDGAV